MRHVRDKILALRQPESMPQGSQLPIDGCLRATDSHGLVLVQMIMFSLEGTAIGLLRTPSFVLLNSRRRNLFGETIGSEEAGQMIECILLAGCRIKSIVGVVGEYQFKQGIKRSSAGCRGCELASSSIRDFLLEHAARFRLAANAA